MSDRELRELEREHAGGDESVLPRLLSARFRADPSLENALALFDFIWEQTEYPINIQESYILLLITHAPDTILERLNQRGPHRLFIGLISFTDPKPHQIRQYKKIQEARDATISIIREQKSDADLDGLILTINGIRQIMDLLLQNNIQPSRLENFISLVSSYHNLLIEDIDLIRADRNILRDEFNRYLALLTEYEPLEAGIVWYQEKREDFRKRFKRKVLDPDDEVIYAQIPDGPDGTFAAECFFPLYDYLNSNLATEAPAINFLAALEIDDMPFHVPKEEIEEEEAEKYAAELEISYEDLTEGDYYSEYRRFEREFEEEIYPKRVTEQLEEEIDEIIERLINEYILSEPSMTVTKLLQSYEEGFVGNYEIYHEDRLEELDADWESEVSTVVDEPFENWELDKSREFWLRPNIIPLDAYQRQHRYGYYREVPSRSTFWWKLKTRPICHGKPPMIKLDTRAIGWKAAFGIEPL